MLPEEGISTAIANMSNANISTIAGLSTVSGLSTSSLDFVNIYNFTSNINGFQISSINVLSTHYESFSFDISTLNTLSTNELNWFHFSVTTKYIELLNPLNFQHHLTEDIYNYKKSTINNTNNENNFFFSTITNMQHIQLFLN